MRIKAIVAILAIMVAALPCLALANDAIEAAEYSVRNLVRSKLGSRYRVVFESTEEKFLSLTEEIVSGKGHVYDGNNWDFDRSFNFSVKVKYDGSSTRDLTMTYNNGEKHSDLGDWKKSNHGSQYLYIDSPRWYEKMGTGMVNFEGRSRSDVRIRVYDRNNNLVAEGVAPVADGRFRKSLSLTQGTYRAILSTSGWSDGDEVRFSIGGGDQDWGRPTANLKVAEPARDARIRSNKVTFSGNSSERSVWLQVWDSRNNRVVDKDIPVQNRYFNTTVNLNDGSYHYTIMVGASAETRDFVVDTGDRPWQPGNNAQLSVSSPGRNQRVTTGRVTFSGSSSESSVWLQVWDSRNNRIVDKDIPVRNRYYSTEVNLQDGDYRMTIMVGANSDSRDFRVDTGYKKPIPGGSGGAMLSVSTPGRNQRLNNSRVTFSGSSSEKSVWLQVWDDRNNRIVDKDIPVVNRYWNSQVVLEDGNYKFTVMVGASSDTRSFSVSTGRAPSKSPTKKPTPTGPSTVRVTQPGNGSTVSGPRITVAGNCPDSAVLVQVWDARNTMVVERRVPTANGYFNTSIPMGSGRYKVRVTGHSGSNYQEFYFTVR